MKLVPGLLVAGALALPRVGLAAAPSSLTWSTPVGWVEHDDPKNRIMTVFTPPGVPQGQVCFLGALVAVPTTLSAHDFHLATLAAATGGSALLDSRPAGTIGSFEVTVLNVQAPNAAPLRWRVYTTRWADRGQGFVLVSSSDDLLLQYTTAVDALVQKISVPGALPMAKNTPPPATPIPRVTGGAGLSGIYATVKNKGGMYVSLQKDYIVFFPDGYALWRLPQEGLFDFDVAKSRRDEAEYWGRYELRGNQVTIHWTQGGDYHGQRQPNGSLLLESYTYLPLSGPDGRKLDGTYRPSSMMQGPLLGHAPDCCDVTFHPDGRFEDRGVRTVAGNMNAKVSTDGGKGRYRIAQDTLVLEYDDGRRDQLSFYVADGDKSSAPPVIVINTFGISRLK